VIVLILHTVKLPFLLWSVNCSIDALICCFDAYNSVPSSFIDLAELLELQRLVALFAVVCTHHFTSLREVPVHSWRHIGLPVEVRLHSRCCCIHCETTVNLFWAADAAVEWATHLIASSCHNRQLDSVMLHGWTNECIESLARCLEVSVEVGVVSLGHFQ